MVVPFDTNSEFISLMRRYLNNHELFMKQNKIMMEILPILEEITEKQKTLLDNLIMTNSVIFDMNLEEAVSTTVKKYHYIQTKYVNISKDLLCLNNNMLDSNLDICKIFIDLCLDSDFKKN